MNGESNAEVTMKCEILYAHLPIHCYIPLHTGSQKALSQKLAVCFTGCNSVYLRTLFIPFNDRLKRRVPSKGYIYDGKAYTSKMLHTFNSTPKNIFIMTNCQYFFFLAHFGVCDKVLIHFRAIHAATGSLIWIFIYHTTREMMKRKKKTR